MSAAGTILAPRSESSTIVRASMTVINEKKTSPSSKYAFVSLRTREHPRKMNTILRSFVLAPGSFGERYSGLVAGCLEAIFETLLACLPSLATTLKGRGLGLPKTLHPFELLAIAQRAHVPLGATSSNPPRVTRSVWVWHAPFFETSQQAAEFIMDSNSGRRLFWVRLRAAGRWGKYFLREALKAPKLIPTGTSDCNCGPRPNSRTRTSATEDCIEGNGGSSSLGFKSRQ
ncbi:hypothetical protein B0H13DRAFT_1878471 [Mycena leptocephala]|nr:hypothetical protein B0H13DRAFT_1878471 [Mycena leptocephala]